MCVREYKVEETRGKVYQRELDTRANQKGGSSFNCSDMEGFGDGSSAHGLSSVIMLPLAGSSNGANHEADNNLFLLAPPPPLSVDHGFPENSNNNNNSSTNNGASSGNSNFITSLVVEHGSNNNNNHNNMTNSCYFPEGEHSSSLRAKIMAHPHYPRLLAAYINCHKVGAPAEVVARLEEAYAAAEAVGRAVVPAVSIGEDPALDQFMEAYCEMLSKYEEELAKPIKEAMVFLSRLECQFKALSLPNTHSAYDDLERNASSGDDVDVNDSFIDPLAEDRELKGQLLRKYSGYLGSLKQEFLKKRKKGKLPKEARQQLLDWWSRHYKWPYPSESQKVALAESTGLDQKQINNWFINQRKRHWKPSEEMQFVVMDATHPHYYLGERVLPNPFSMDCAPAYL